MKKIFIIIIAVIAFGFIVSKFLPTQPAGVPDDQAELVMFWGDGCPHCEKVKDYIKSKKMEDKIKISYKEVYYNKTNQNLLAETVKKCPEIDTKDGIGVPLAFDKTNSKCLYGDQPIIDWLDARVLK